MPTSARLASAARDAQRSTGCGNGHLLSNAETARGFVMQLYRKLALYCGMTLLGGLLLAPLAAAHSEVQEDGTRYCGGNETQKVRARTSGHTHVYPGPNGYGEYSNGGDLTVTTTYANSNGGGYWKVTTGGTLDGNETYARCVTSGPTSPQS